MTAPLILAPREVRVLGLVADGLSDRAIGSRLGVSEDAVGALLSRAMLRMGTSCRTGAVVVAYREGFLRRCPARVQVPRMSPETTRVLGMVAAARSNREIGLALGIGEAAAGSRVRWLLRTFGAANRANLVKAAVDAGVLTQDLKLRVLAPEPSPSVAPQPKARKDSRRRARSAAAVVARTTPDRPSGSLLAALLGELGGARGSQIPEGRLDALILAGIADGRSRAEIAAELAVAPWAVHACLRRLNTDWEVRGDVLLTAEGYRRGLLPAQPDGAVSLTGSESNLLALLARHGSYAAVADVTGRCEDTVSTHAGRLFLVLGARTGANAVKRGVDTGVLALVPELVTA